ncbi:MAG: hypothetical protein U0559_09315 [Anaerolineae bacterium]
MASIWSATNSPAVKKGRINSKEISGGVIGDEVALLGYWRIEAQCLRGQYVRVRSIGDVNVIESGVTVTYTHQLPAPRSCSTPGGDADRAGRRSP